ncbi:serine/threonine-protein phosphatase 6 regulatory ankyrin repeat subunit B [Microdochium nivale]|nr:serine/threonine-protein phosphatase 6 regulatory ankyrin repeat subunit B [Microdochium nivale]
MSIVPEHSSNDSTIWERHQETIRGLYLGSNKSLSQLKTILEEKHNFPPFTLSTYESRVRDTLGLRKKIKTRDWAAIWAHCRQIQKQDATPVVFFHGRRIPWAKAWKEIRRHGAQRDPAPSVALPRLPQHVIVRCLSESGEDSTPRAMASPERREDALLPEMQPSSKRLQSEGFAELEARISLSSSRKGSDNCRMVGTFSGGDADSVAHYSGHHLSLSKLPAVKLLHAMRGNQEDDSERILLGIRPYMPPNCNHGVVDSVMLKEARRNVEANKALSDLLHPSLPWGPATKREGAVSPSALEYGDLIRELRPDADLAGFFALAMFRSSNNMVNTTSLSWFDILLFHIIFQRAPSSLYLKTMNSEHPFYMHFGLFLFKIAHQLEYHGVASWLAELGMFHSLPICAGGMVAIVSELICSFAFDGHESFLRTVLAGLPVSPDLVPSLARALHLALDEGHFKCAELLTRQCDVNLRPEGELSIFQSFLLERQDHQRHSFIQAVFLEQHADLDDKPPPSVVDDRGACGRLLARFYRNEELLDRWHPSCIDYMYSELSSCETLTGLCPAMEASTLSRFCTAARAGTAELENYLELRNDIAPKQRRLFVESMFAAQFLRESKAIDWRTVSTILSTGIDVQLPNFSLSSSDIMHLAIDNLRRHEVDITSALEYLRLLFDSDLTLDQHSLAAAVSPQDIDLLKLLLVFARKTKDLGGLALATAARLNNLDALDCLLAHGVPVNSHVFDKSGYGWHAIYLASCGADTFRSIADTSYISLCPESTASLGTIQHMMTKGALLRKAPGEEDVSRWLCDYVLSHTTEETTRMLEILTSSGVRVPSRPRPEFLEACLKTQNWALLSLVIKEKAMPPPAHGFFQLLVGTHPPSALTRSLLDLISSDTTCHPEIKETRSLVLAAASLDLEVMQDVLARSPHLSASAPLPSPLLQACSLSVRDPNTVRRRLAAVDLLLAHNANVNTQDWEGRTPMHFAAEQGDLELALSLLRTGADCNIANYSGRKALDLAALNGRLDMVYLLLELTNVDRDVHLQSAIRRAEEGKHVHIMHILRRYAAEHKSPTSDDEDQPCHQGLKAMAYPKASSASGKQVLNPGDKVTNSRSMCNINYVLSGPPTSPKP